MCGIFGFLSAPGAPANPAAVRFFEAVDRLTAFASGTEPPSISALEEGRRSEILHDLLTAQEEAYRWVERDSFLAALLDGNLRQRLRRALEAVKEWVRTLEASAGRTGLASQSDWEFLNRLVVGGKDIAWQLEKDLFESFGPLRALLGEAGASEDRAHVLAHAWQLHLVLRSLDRLEVRGRDSAGLALYLRFARSRDLDAFLQGYDGGVSRIDELRQRAQLPALTHATVVRPQGGGPTLLAVFKVANEVGKMGDNVAFLREAIARDRMLQSALRVPGVEIQCLAHTRWASNGVISLPNCHPVDGALAGDPPQRRGEIVAVLNGDVDNYLELLERHVHRKGLRLEEGVTTDAKIIPIVLAEHYRETGDLREAFRRAFAEFEGSMAIGVMAADRPGEFLFGQKGSGQGLFLGFGGLGVAVASEMYGLVEMTPRYVKADGERIEGGEIFHLKAEDEGVQVNVLSSLEVGPLQPGRTRLAEISTRDINRGNKPHFFAKEIAESVESVRRTLRGKFERKEGGVISVLGREVLAEELLERLRAGRIRRVLCIGQGTAAVAAQGIAFLLEEALRRAASPLTISAMKATELSGHGLRSDMTDTLVVAVSQSGTTTDTNRTVDLIRERGAWVLAIVNRRNSDLVFKSQGVLYTSDGRDVEMSVASTKAFYAQNVAGQVLALALAAELGTLSPQEIARRVEEMERLPTAMAATLALESQVAEIAQKLTISRRHWAVVGSGTGKTAADEIRIKLSELCYKSISVDFLEDKKHIDLSSEPVIIVCANGVPPATVSDLVKEVSIFKAHKSVPIVIADEGEDRFDPYAAGAIKVPREAGALSYLLTTMVGHLLGYHAAVAMDRLADQLRALRAEVRGLHVGALGADTIPPAVTSRVVEIESLLLAGKLDAGIGAGAATRLYRGLEVLLGRLPPQALGRPHANIEECVTAALSEAIAEVSRPIDAIKHQAKTVTVGISRNESAAKEGILIRTLRQLGFSPDDVEETDRQFLSAFEPLVRAVEGTTVYQVDGLDPLGRPTEAATIRVLDKTGVSRGIASRCETVAPLAGTKWGVIREGRIHLGKGKTDGRQILVLPLTAGRSSGHLALFHMDLSPRGRRETRLLALRACPGRVERLRIAVTERNIPWNEALVDAVDNDVLFLEDPDAAAEEMLGDPLGALKSE